MGYESREAKKGISITRWIVIFVALVSLFLIYIFQRFNAAAILLAGFSPSPNAVFIFNKSLRLVLNDFCCFTLIWAIFQEKKYLRIAFYIFLLEVLIILPVYFAIKLSWEGDSEISSPLLSQVHRLIVNPTLMLLLLAGFFYQRLSTRNE